jgi:hypothetical protein
MHTRWFALCFLLSVGLVSGCDPGVRYVPQEWSSAGDHLWTYQNDDLSAKLITPGGIVWSTSFVLEPEITNLRSQRLVFETVTINAREKTYSGEFGGANRLEVRTVDAGETKRIPIYFFDLDSGIAEALGDRFNLVVTYQVGDDQRELSFEFVR